MEEPAKPLDDDALREIIECYRDPMVAPEDDLGKLNPIFEYVERGLSDLVVLAGATIRGVVLGGSKVSSELRVKKGDAAFTILVSEEVAKRLGAFVGDRVTLLMRPG